MVQLAVGSQETATRLNRASGGKPGGGSVKSLSYDCSNLSSKSPSVCSMSHIWRTKTAGTHNNHKLMKMH